MRVCICGIVRERHTCLCLCMCVSVSSRKSVYKRVCLYVRGKALSKLFTKSFPINVLCYATKMYFHFVLKIFSKFFSIKHDLYDICITFRLFIKTFGIKSIPIHYYA